MNDKFEARNVGAATGREESTAVLTGESDALFIAPARAQGSARVA